MERLKKEISKEFIIYAFLLSVLESIVDSSFDEYLMPRFTGDETLSYILIAVYIIVCIGLFVIFGFLFTRNVSKKINEETQRQVKERTILYTNIAHDLKTPITSILGFSRALQEKDLDKEKQMHLLGRIYPAAQREEVGWGLQLPKVLWREMEETYYSKSLMESIQRLL